MVARSDTKHFVTMDGLRGVAAVVVVFYHAVDFWKDKPLSWHGYLAVDFFFLLSGFVIAHAYGLRLADRRLSIPDFLIARAIRLYPMIILGALLGTIVPLVYASRSHWLGLAIRALGALALGAFCLPQPFITSGAFYPNLPAWSLFFEIVANILYVLLVPRLANRWISIIAVTSGAALAAVIFAYGNINIGPNWLEMPAALLRVLFPFSVGVLMQRLHLARRLPIPRLPVWVLAPILVLVLRIPVSISPAVEIGSTLISIFVIFPLIVASASHDEPSPFWHWASKLSSEISYPLYLVHMPIVLTANLSMSWLGLAPIIRLAIFLPFCIVTALLISKFYDAPVRRWLAAWAARWKTKRLGLSRSAAPTA